MDPPPKGRRSDSSIDFSAYLPSFVLLFWIRFSCCRSLAPVLSLADYEADAYSQPVPACRAVLSAVTLAVRVGNGVPRRVPQSLLIDAFGTAAGSVSARALKHKVCPASQVYDF